MTQTMTPNSECVLGPSVQGKGQLNAPSWCPTVRERGMGPLVSAALTLKDPPASRLPRVTAVLSVWPTRP